MICSSGDSRRRLNGTHTRRTLDIKARFFFELAADMQMNRSDYQPIHNDGR